MKRTGAPAEVSSVDAKRSKTQGVPSYTIYVSNLNDKIKITSLKQLLFLLMMSYGEVIEIRIDWNNKKMRGQAHVVFGSKVLASRALNKLEKFNFYGKPLNLEYLRASLKVIKEAEKEL